MYFAFNTPPLISGLLSNKADNQLPIILLTVIRIMRTKPDNLQRVNLLILNYQTLNLPITVFPSEAYSGINL